jgi:fatty acid desaturase
VIHTDQAEHEGLVSGPAPMRRRKAIEGRMTALAVIAAVAASAGLLQYFHDDPAPSGSAAPNSGAYSAAR